CWCNVRRAGGERCAEIEQGRAAPNRLKHRVSAVLERAAGTPLSPRKESGHTTNNKEHLLPVFVLRLGTTNRDTRWHDFWLRPRRGRRSAVKDPSSTSEAPAGSIVELFTLGTGATPHV